MDIGILWAFLTILLFGSWAVPAKTLDIPPRVLAFWLTIGHFALSGVIYLAYGQSLAAGDIPVPFLMGIVWALGTAAGYASIQEIGITRAIGTWAPVIILVSAFWGLTVFGEKPTGWLLAFGLIAVIGAAMCMIYSSKHEETVNNRTRGYVLAVTLGVCHGSFFVPLQDSDLPIQVTFLPLTIGMVATMAVVVWLSGLRVRYDVVAIGRMTAAGVILGAGNYLALATVTALGVAVGYPLTQLGIVVNTLWGVFAFREVTTSAGKRLILLGVVLAIFGATLANMART